MCIVAMEWLAVASRWTSWVPSLLGKSGANSGVPEERKTWLEWEVESELRALSEIAITVSVSPNCATTRPSLHFEFTTHSASMLQRSPLIWRIRTMANSTRLV